jgi:hypothetical protein
MAIKWNIIFRQNTEACTELYCWIKKITVPSEVSAIKISQDDLKYVIGKHHNGIITMDSILPFFDEREISVSVYLVKENGFAFFAQNKSRKVIRNDFDNRQLANENAIICALELLNENLNC